MYLLPRENIVNKIASCQRCDIFPDATADNTQDQVEDFVRLIEAVSKLKRQFARKARVRRAIPFQVIICEFVIRCVKSVTPFCLMA